MALAILNTSILTADGSYTLKTITLRRARKLLVKNAGQVNSAVGHQATADILTTLLGVKVEKNRQEYMQKKGETVLVLKLNGRAPEGKILSLRRRAGTRTETTVPSNGSAGSASGTGRRVGTPSWRPPWNPFRTWIAEPPQRAWPCSGPRPSVEPTEASCEPTRADDKHVAACGDAKVLRTHRG